MDVTEYVHGRLDEETTRFVLENRPRPRAEPEHIARELHRREVADVLFWCLLAKKHERSERTQAERAAQVKHRTRGKISDVNVDQERKHQQQQQQQQLTAV